MLRISEKFIPLVRKHLCTITLYYELLNYMIMHLNMYNCTIPIFVKFPEISLYSIFRWFLSQYTSMITAYGYNLPLQGYPRNQNS